MGCSFSIHFFPFRHQDQEDLRDRYPKKEERSKSISTRDKGVLSGVQDKSSKYTYSDKTGETDGGNAIELSRDRSLNCKVSISIELVKKISSLVNDFVNANDSRVFFRMLTLKKVDEGTALLLMPKTSPLIRIGIAGNYKERSLHLRWMIHLWQSPILAKVVRAIHHHSIHALVLGVELTFLLMVHLKMMADSILIAVSEGAMIRVEYMETLGEAFQTGQHHYQMALSLSSMDLLLMEVSNHLCHSFQHRLCLVSDPHLISITREFIIGCLMLTDFQVTCIH